MGLNFVAFGRDYCNTNKRYVCFDFFVVGKIIYKLTYNNCVRGNTANIDLSLINILRIFVELEVGTYVAVKKLHLLGII